ncbi:MAG TPA: hypothetical protein DEA08_02740 [Planctomycetes bacterium]|nr:hypothetical protein [Planctomycetota bacterium]
MRTRAPLLGLLGLTLLLGATGCNSSQQANRLYFLDSQAGEEHPATHLGMPLHSGQLILAEGPGAYSFLFSLGTESYVNFTHAGILVFEDGEPFVYEMTGEYKPGFDERPTDGIEGSCRRLPFVEYCMAYLYVEVFDPPEGVDSAKVTAWVRQRYEEGQEFDPYFDYSEHEKLFCTEFIQLAMVAGGGEPLPLQPVRTHPAVQRLLEWFQVARDASLPAGAFADEGRYRAALGMLPSRTAAYCYFAAKAEIHRRFRDDQRLGNLFMMDGFSDVDLRPTVKEFLGKAVRLFPVTQKLYPRDEIRARVSALADEMFGVQQG